MTEQEKRARKRDAMKRVSRVEEILRRWDPIGVDPGNLAPTDEYDAYAPHIVSMVAQGCSIEELCEHLGVIRMETIGVESNESRDREIAGKILDALHEKAV